MADQLAPAQIPSALGEAGLDGWRLEDGWITRTFAADGWPHTLMAVNAVGFVCEIANHHADLEVSYGELTVKLQDHSAGGISAKDVATARRIEDALLWRPDADGPLEGGTPEDVVSAKG